MFRDVLVVVDATSDAREALSQAIDLARRERSRLTLITVERRLPACAYLGVAAALPSLSLPPRPRPASSCARRSPAYRPTCR